MSDKNTPMKDEQPDDSDLITFGEAFNMLRMLRNMSRRELSNKAEVSVSMLVHMESGKSRPNADTLAKVLQALAVPDAAASLLLISTMGVRISRSRLQEAMEEHTLERDHIAFEKGREDATKVLEGLNIKERQVLAALITQLADDQKIKISRPQENTTTPTPEQDPPPAYRTPDERSFGFWLARYRKEVLRINRSELAELCGQTEYLIGALETVSVAPPKPLAEDVARNLGFASEDLADFVAFATDLLRIADTNYTPSLRELPPLESVYGSERKARNTLETHFDFPEAVRVPCQQYLLYFVEFLRDIGVDASAELREDAQGVLFAVTPKDKDEALDNIREALQIYLHLPTHANPITVITPETSIEVQKLSAQLGIFQSQLMLANASIQQQQMLIQQKDWMIQQQQGLIHQQRLSAEVLVQSLQQDTEQGDDGEPIIGDIVKVKQFDWQVIQIDLPTLLRRLKEQFGRKKLP